MAKTKNSKIIKHRKRWMRATRGSTSFKYVSFFIFGIGLLGVSAAIFTYVRGQRLTFTPLPTVSHTTEVPDTGELLHRVNIERAANNRAELTNDDRLKAVAEERLNDMVNRQQYSHKNLEGKYYYDLFADHGFSTSYSCENLDIEPDVMPAKFIQSWLGSGGGHKECMLSDKVSHAGIASGRFTTDDKTRGDNFLVVVVFAAQPQDLANNDQ